MIKLKHISYISNDGFTILDDVSFDVPDEKITTLIGPNGAGKSTLLKIILGILKPTKGELIKPDNYTVGYVPQKFNINTVLPINVDRFLHLCLEKKDNNFEEVLDKTGIRNLLNRQLSQLSGGETQRVLLARALLRKPNLLVLDEPAQGLDPIGSEKLYALIGDINKNSKTAVLMVSHDLFVVMKNTDNVICLNHHICCSGLPEKVQTLSEYTSLYTHHHDHCHTLHGDISHEHK
ncbi:MAG: metal ABC transporter ATP-binding protein [Alphaproteobacteria bacterium]|nr:metal ABC transporter ATP-binding protein [Alphaproteobacteria bacterium]